MGVDISVDSLDFEEITIRDMNGNEQTFNLKDELSINRHDIRTDLEEHPGKYMYWAGVLEKVRAYLESAELELETTFSALYEPVRVSLEKKIGKNPTKVQIEAVIYQQESYITAKEKVNDIQYQVKRLQYVVKNFEARKDMLIQISTTERKEREYEQALNQY